MMADGGAILVVAFRWLEENQKCELVTRKKAYFTDVARLSPFKVRG